MKIGSVCDTTVGARFQRRAALFAPSADPIKGLLPAARHLRVTVPLG